MQKNPFLKRENLFVKKMEEGLDYIKSYNIDLYNETSLEIEKIKNLYPNKEDYIVRDIEMRSLISPIVLDIFKKSGKKLELSSTMYKCTNCNYILTNEKEVSIDGRYEIINDNCFYFSPQVETLIFEEGIKWVNDNACINLPNLKTVYFPKTLKGLYSHCFANCKNLEHVHFKNQNAQIDPSSFQSTKWFSQFNDEFIIINNQLLKYNGSAKEVIIPEGVTSINFEVFNENELIEKVVFPVSLQKICVASFGGCSNLKEAVFLGDNVKTILPMAFDGCKNLKEIFLPKSLKEIGCEAFSKHTTIICHKDNPEMIKYIKNNYPQYKIKED